MDYIWRMTSENTPIHLSEICIIPIRPREGHIGYTTFILDERFYVGNVGIHSTPTGDIRLLYPSAMLPNGKLITTFHPITKYAGLEITRQVAAKYNELLEQSVLRGHSYGI